MKARARSTSMLVVVMLLSIAGLVTGAAARAAGDTWPLIPDQQRYATAHGADPYQDTDLHVSLVGGKPQAISFVHFNLSALPAGSNLSGFAVTLTPNETSGQNVSQSAAFGEHISACIETKPFPAQFDPLSTDVPYDCSKLAVPLSLRDDGVWAADLGKFVAEWRAHGNTGLALVAVPGSTGAPQGDAVAGGSQDNYVVSFDHTKTVANITYTLAAGAPRDDTRSNPVIATEPIAQPLSQPAVGSSLAAAVDVGAVAPLPASAPQAPGSTSSGPQPWIYGFVALWAVCATLLAVGVIMKLHTLKSFSVREVFGAIRRAARQKSTWIAGVPLLIVVAGTGGGFTYLMYMNAKVTPPLTFSDGAPTQSVTGADTASRAGAQPAAAHATNAAQQPTSTNVLAAKHGAPGVTGFDGRWILGSGTVAGYRIGYASPTGRGIRTGRTNGTDGVKGEIRIAGTSVESATFSVEMSKVNCDGGSACTTHINEIMDAANHPYETFELTRPIEIANVPAEGQQITVPATGKLTLRGVTRLVTFDLSARRVSGHIEVLGSIPVHRDDYKIPDSGEPGFTIDQDGRIEILMVLTRA